MDQLEQFKDLLSEPKQIIKLHDFVAQATKVIVSELNTTNFDVKIYPDDSTFVGRIYDYEKVIRSMLSNEMLLGRWAQKQQSQVSTIPLRRIGETIGPSGGTPYLLAARWYPVCLLLYAGCIGAVAGDNYEIIYQLTHISGMQNPYGRNNDDVLVVSVFRAMAEIHNGFKLLPGLGQRQTPRSEYIYKLLEVPAEDILYLGAEYEKLFDRVEMFMALEYIHLEHPEKVSENERPWAPVGKFGWKTLYSNPLSQLRAEAVGAGDGWAPLQAGLFGGSSERFLEIADGLLRYVSRIGWM